MKARLADIVLEARIRCLWWRIKATRNRIALRTLWGRYAVLVAMRSPDQVRRMEHRAGLI